MRTKICTCEISLTSIFGVDLCHQAYDDDDYEGSFCDNPLLEKTSNESNLASIDSHRKCFPFRFGRVGNRQKIVILVTLLVFIIVVAFVVVIWIGLGKNPIDSEVAAQVSLCGDSRSTGVPLESPQQKPLFNCVL
ncbi:hypothetical protein glysoja_038101 [Glycine soja]|uniref:Uncharacterized protein n=1 Tax=Glycine soja TaxID=3848 RepID=A0A0B2PY28_GLYSO|nr:hypothetical protein glysoja_038101 [Glycine soja]